MLVNCDTSTPDEFGINKSPSGSFDGRETACSRVAKYDWSEVEVVVVVGTCHDFVVAREYFTGALENNPLRSRSTPAG